MPNVHRGRQKGKTPLPSLDMWITEGRSIIYPNYSLFFFKKKLFLSHLLSPVHQTVAHGLFKGTGRTNITTGRIKTPLVLDESRASQLEYIILSYCLAVGDVT